MRSYWLKIDEKVQSLTSDQHEINQIFGWVEDQNELLMYIVDILAIETLDEEIADMIMMSLLNIGYLPCLVNSLVDMKSGGKIKKFSLNTCIFILIQTFKIFKESKNPVALQFLKVLTITLFTNKKIPQYLLKFVMDQGKQENKHVKLKKYMDKIQQNQFT